MNQDRSDGIAPQTVILMAVAVGVAIANVYYNQPLLVDIQQGLGVTPAEAGFLPVATQLGLALGILLLVPLGDLLERRRLLVVLSCGTAIALLGMALAVNLSWAVIASLGIGLTTMVPYLLLPLANEWAKPDQQGRVLGTILSGLFVGILLARTVSGLVGAWVGWRYMYALASGLMLILVLALHRLLPESRPQIKTSYAELLLSLWHLVRSQPLLRKSSLLQAMLFGCLIAFWGVLAFFLAGPPYNYGSEVAGMFGLVGLVTAFAAPRVGQMVDRSGSNRIIGISIALVAIALLVLLFIGYSLWGLILGTVLLDLGVQSAHLANQNRIYRLVPGAGNRIGTVYFVSSFIGGGLGSFLQTYAWKTWHWTGACLVCLLMTGIAFLVHGWGQE